MTTSNVTCTRACARDPLPHRDIEGDSVSQTIVIVKTFTLSVDKISPSIQSRKRCPMSADAIEIRPEELSIHELPVVERRVGTACGITLEIRRSEEGIVLVALPTIEGCSIVIKGTRDDFELLELTGKTMLHLFSKTAPLLTGDHFRAHGTAANFQL